MEKETDIVTLPFEDYVPADIRRMLDNPCLYFESHPCVRRLLFTGTPLSATSPPFRPNRPQSVGEPPRTTRVVNSVASVSPVVKAVRVAGVVSRHMRRDALPTVEKRTTQLPTVPAFSTVLPKSLMDLAVVTSTQQTTAVCTDLTKFVTPSGPRQVGEGTQETTQSILKILSFANKAKLVHVTLLVAGFIIGPSGETIRGIMTQARCHIYSYTEMLDRQKCRVFFIEGKESAVARATEIMKKGVARYKELAEGMYEGKQVDKKQYIESIAFYYQPPPRSLVPYAASLKVERGRRNGKYSK